MQNQTRIIMLAILILILAVIFFVITGCTSFDPKNDKNVSYTFETISYESPNSSPAENLGGSKQTMTIPVRFK